MNKIRFHHKQELQSAWAKDRNLYAPNADKPPLCLRCGRPLDGSLSENTFTRVVNVFVCHSCGVEEDARYSGGRALPLSKWHAAEHGRLSTIKDDAVVLTDVCSFSHIFTGPKKKATLSSQEYPESELAYSRSDYDGRKWWRNWFPCTEKKVAPEIAAEMDTFTNLLMAMPEFRTIWDMGCACKVYAEPTSEPTEYNLYAETEHFYIWLRLITRERDYNLYCHFYEKAAVR